MAEVIQAWAQLVDPNIGEVRSIPLDTAGKGLEETRSLVSQGWMSPGTGEVTQWEGRVEEVSKELQSKGLQVMPGDLPKIVASGGYWVVGGRVVASEAQAKELVRVAESKALIQSLAKQGLQYSREDLPKIQAGGGWVVGGRVYASEQEANVAAQKGVAPTPGLGHIRWGLEQALKAPEGKVQSPPVLTEEERQLKFVQVLPEELRLPEEIPHYTLPVGTRLVSEAQERKEYEELIKKLPQELLTEEEKPRYAWPVGTKIVAAPIVDVSETPIGQVARSGVEMWPAVKPYGEPKGFLGSLSRLPLIGGVFRPSGEPTVISKGGELVRVRPPTRLEEALTPGGFGYPKIELVPGMGYQRAWPALSGVGKVVGGVLTAGAYGAPLIGKVFGRAPSVVSPFREPGRLVGAGESWPWAGPRLTPKLTVPLGARLPVGETTGLFKQPIVRGLFPPPKGELMFVRGPQPYIWAEGPRPAPFVYRPFGDTPVVTRVPHPEIRLGGRITTVREYPIGAPRVLVPEGPLPVGIVPRPLVKPAVRILPIPTITFPYVRPSVEPRRRPVILPLPSIMPGPSIEPLPGPVPTPRPRILPIPFPIPQPQPIPFPQPQPRPQPMPSPRIPFPVPKPYILPTPLPLAPRVEPFTPPFPRVSPLPRLVPSPKMPKPAILPLPIPAPGPFPLPKPFTRLQPLPKPGLGPVPLGVKIPPPPYTPPTPPPPPPPTPYTPLRPKIPFFIPGWPIGLGRGSVGGIGISRRGPVGGWVGGPASLYLGGPERPLFAMPYGAILSGMGGYYHVFTPLEGGGFGVGGVYVDEKVAEARATAVGGIVYKSNLLSSQLVLQQMAQEG